jgi:type IV secretion system protein VirB9
MTFKERHMKLTKRATSGAASGAISVPFLPAALFAALCAAGCATAHFDAPQSAPAERPAGIDSLEDEDKAEKKEAERLFIEEELKSVDIEPTVVYVDRPVYSPEEPPEKQLSGAEAVERSASTALQTPLKFVNGVMFYPWDETFVYEIHCQPYRTTDVMLDPGEEVLEMPFLSEEKVWEVGAGVSRKNGLDTQHFFLKPSYSGLTTSMIVITTKRVYHLLLKSYRDRYMAMVRWEYPQSMPFTVKQNAMNERSVNSLERDAALVDPALLSFDYKMTYSVFRKPVWLPKRVYDDGRKTYIELDERTLHMESPALFDGKNRRVNYRVWKTLIIIDELIEKVTLKRGKEKVTIVKKTYRAPKEEEPDDGPKEAEASR